MTGQVVNKPPRRKPSALAITVTIIVALLGATTFWSFLSTVIQSSAVFSVSPTPTSTPSPPCNIQAGEITIAKSKATTGEVINLSIEAIMTGADQPSYQWYAQSGDITPKGRTPRAEAIYTAPSFATNDTVAVIITSSQCNVSKSKALSVFSSGNTPTPTLTATPIPTIIPSPTTTPIPIFTEDELGSGISRINFNYDTNYGGGSIALELCVETRYYRISANEIHPNARLLVDHIEEMSQHCITREVVTRVSVGDIELICIGAKDSSDEIRTAVQCYRITRKYRDFEVVREVEIVPTPASSKPLK
jgi:hypothetical protein